MNPNTIGLPKLFDEAQDFMPLYGTDYVELYVSNSKQAAHYYKTAGKLAESFKENFKKFESYASQEIMAGGPLI